MKSTDEKVKYEWTVNDKKIKGNDDCYKISDNGVLSIQEFEKKYEGNYVCTLSTASKPKMSLSTQVQVNLKGKETYYVPLHNYQECFCALDVPEKFDSKMNTNRFILFLNANGISYNVCKRLEGETVVFKSTVDNTSITCAYFLPGCDITAEEFNLESYDLWSKEIQLSWKEKPALKKLIGKSPQLYRDYVGST